MKWSVVSVLLLVCNTSHAAFWKKNDKDKNHRRRLTERNNNNNNDVELDAATGTVIDTTGTQKQKDSCDGQMAQSLVKANEELLQTQLLLTEERETHATQVESLTSKLQLNKQDLVKQYELQLEKAEERRQKEEGKWQFKIQKERETTALLTQQHEDATEKVKQEVNAMEETNKQTIASLETKMKEQDQRNTQELETYKQEAKAFLLKQLQEKDAKIKAAQEMAQTAETKLQDSMEELESWRATFAGRSYCNVTHMGEDIAFASNQAYDQTRQLSKQLYATSLAYTIIAYEVTKEKSLIAYEVTKTYTIKASKDAKKQYQKHVLPQYQQHVQPLVKQHVHPLVDKANVQFKSVKEQVQPNIDVLKKNYNAQMDSLAVTYAKTCKRSYKLVKRVANKHSIEFFDESIAPSFEYSCQHPNESLRAAQYGILVLLLLPFSWTILRMVLSIVKLVLRIIIAITPLRFVISMKPKKKGVEPVGGDVRVKKKKQKKNQIPQSQ